MVFSQRFEIAKLPCDAKNMSMSKKGGQNVKLSNNPEEIHLYVSTNQTPTI